MKYMKRLDSNFLDCHHWTGVWVNRVDEIEKGLSRLKIAPPFGVQQIQINFLRTDTEEGVSGGEHVALLVNLRSCWLLIDHTHNQFDLPKELLRDLTAIQARYRAVWETMETYVGQEKGMESVIAKWLVFLQGKPFLRQVHNSGIKYYGKKKVWA